MDQATALLDRETETQIELDARPTLPPPDGMTSDQFAAFLDALTPQ